MLISSFLDVRVCRCGIELLNAFGLNGCLFRYGEWLFSNGKKLFFGKMPEGDSVTLFYPSKDIPTYHIKMQMQHVPFKLISNSYQENDYKMKEGKDDMTKFYNDLNESVYKASEENYQKETFQNLHLGGYAEEDSRKKILDVVSKVQARGAKAGMLIYEGQTLIIYKS